MWALHWVPSDLGSSLAGGPSARPISSQAQAVGMQNLRHETLGGGQPHPQSLFCMELDTMWALHWVPSDLGSSLAGGPSARPISSQAQAVGMQNLRHETLGGGQPHPQTLFCMELDTMWALHWVPSDLGSSLAGGPSTKMGHSNLRAGGAARSHWWGWDTPFGRCKEVGAGGGGP